MNDVLFRHIAALQGDTPWGALLDAGTGRSSLAWVRSLPTERWVAVTGADSMAAEVRADAADAWRPQDRLVVGNWTDDALLAGEQFDTVLADYLIGAVDGFSPYGQEQVLARLCAMTRGTLYVVGLEPYVLRRPASDAGRVVCDIGRLRDACLLMAGERPYREYPMAWVERELARNGFAVTSARAFPIRYRARFIDSQLDMCRQRTRRLADRALAAALDAHVEALRERASRLSAQEDGLRFGADYVVAARPA